MVKVSPLAAFLLVLLVSGATYGYVSLTTGTTMDVCEYIECQKRPTNFDIVEIKWFFIGHHNLSVTLTLKNLYTEAQTVQARVSSISYKSETLATSQAMAHVLPGGEVTLIYYLQAVNITRRHYALSITLSTPIEPIAFLSLWLLIVVVPTGVIVYIIRRKY